MTRRIHCLQNPLRSGRVRSSLCTAVLFFAVVAECQAVDKFWGNLSGGTFSDAVNWQGLSVAGTADIARFGLTADPLVQQQIYVVGFSANATNQGLRIEDDFVTFDLNGRTYATTAAAGSEIGNEAGRSGRLTITDGIWSVALNSDLLIGVVANASGSLTVTTGGQLSGLPSPLVVGEAGTGTLLIDNGGAIQAGSIRIGNATGAVGTATITGAASAVNTGVLLVGSQGQGVGTLNVTAGGLVQSTSSGNTVGNTAGSTGTVNVDGADSQWANSSDLVFGDSGSGTVNITAGGRIQNANGFVGRSAGGAGLVHVDGVNSQWINSGELNVGYNTSGTLNITAGGRVQNTIGNVGANGGGTGEVTVDGANSQWMNSDRLRVGEFGLGTLSITAGGRVQNTIGSIGANGGGIGTATVSGANSQWINSDRLVVGDGGRGTLNITAGGHVESLDGSVGLNAGHTGTVTVDGANSQWINSGRLVVGEYGIGTLDISAGGFVQSSDGRIGTNTGSTGTVSVGGTGSTWTNTAADLVIGSVAYGTLNINAGGTVNVANTLKLTSNGIVYLNGGQLNILAIDLAGNTFHFNAGALRFTANALLDDLTLDRIFGPEHTIVPLQHMVVAGTPTIQTLLVLDGGTFSAGSLLPGSPLLFTSGTFNLTSDNFTIGAAGLFGDTLTLANRNVNVTNTTTIQSGARLLLQGGSFSSGTALANQGVIDLQNPLSQISGGTLTNSATLRGSGSVLNNVQNNLTGKIQTTAGDRLTFGGTVTNAGSISLVGGEVQFDAAVTNSASTGAIFARDAILRFGSGLVSNGLTNHGSLAVTFGTSDVFGDIANSATGQIVVSGGAQATFYDDIVQNGTFRVSKVGTTTSVAVVLGAFSGSGGSTGGGDIFFEGDLRPGNSPAIVTFGNNVSLGSAARLAIELAGTTPGAQYDQVHVLGQVSLGGTLEADLINGFTPALGDQFTVLTFGSRSGDFSSYAGSDVGGNLILRHSFTANSLDLTARPAIDGDINLDGTVNIFDINSVSLNWNTAGPQGDANGDGIVDIFDVNLISGNWTPTGGGATVVPEPSAIVLALVAAIGCLVGRVSRQRGCQCVNRSQC